MGTKKRASAEASEGAASKKQATINFKNHCKQTDRQATLTLEQEAPQALLEPLLCHELQRASDIYITQWAEKCEPVPNTTTATTSTRRALPTATATREEVDLDAAGIKFIETFKHCMQQAIAKGDAIEHQMLETLVLVLRNDVVHVFTSVSRSAYTTLCAYLEAFPHARVEWVEEDKPVLVTNPVTAWTSITDNLKSFTNAFLMYKDMTVAANKYKQEKQPTKTTKRLSDTQRFRSSLEFVLYAVESGVNSADVDYNGDLLLLRYLLMVIEQDLNCRLTLHSTYSATFTDNNDDELQKKCKALVENSLAWRVFSAPTAAETSLQSLIKGIFQLLVGSDDDKALDEGEEEPTDDIPAGACVFTRRELAALASRLLKTMLRLYGTAEGSGYFLSTGRFRAQASSGINCNKNLRMELDRAMLRELWYDGGVCKTPEDIKSVLRSMEPRDALRLLGQLMADRFLRTWDKEAKGGLTALLDAASMLERGSDAANFFEVDMVSAVASINLDPGRAFKTYRSGEFLAALLSSVAHATHALTSAGQSVPCGESDVAGLKEQLRDAVKNVVTRSMEHSKGGKLDVYGMADVVSTQMVLAVS